MKLKEFQAAMNAKDMGLVVLVSPDPNITYLTQQEFTSAILSISPYQARLFITKLDHTPHLPAGIAISLLDKTWESKIASPTAKIIGINHRHLTVAYLEKFRKIFPQAAFKDISSILDEIRVKKTPLELFKISKACQITSQAYEAAIIQLSKGRLKTEQQVASFLEQEIRNQGAELAFPTIIATGSNAATPHHLTSSQKLRRGFLVMDFGARYKLYCADMTRTIFLGKPTAEEKSRYNLLLASQQLALSKVAENRHFIELDQQVRKKLGRFSSKFTHSLGHGIGIEVHEAPTFSNKKAKVENGQVFTIEPGIYLQGKLGIRIEDTIAFNRKAKVLTTASKEFLRIPL